MALGMALGMACGMVMAVPSRAVAQQKDSARAGMAPVSQQVVVDSGQKPAKAPPVAGGPLKPPISPGTAFLDSFILPGYGQSRLDRAYAGALFFAIEAVSVVRLRQAQIDLKYAQNHINDSTLVVQTYETNPATGQPLRDSTGAPIPATFAYSKYDSALVAARKTHVEDWWAVIIFNHLVSGADAFIEAQLWDLPAHVHPIARETPDGRHLYGASVSW
jgi:hypothetical protein